MILCLLLVSFIFCQQIYGTIPENIGENSDTARTINNLYNKKKIRIVVTDSGLGGISVAAGLEEKLGEMKIFEKVEIIFFNSLPSAEYRYNALPSNEEKARIFNIALEKMEEMYSPDIILIACNTLSVVYPFTDFSKKKATLVLGIVEFGVEQIIEEYIKNENSSIILLGTKTTIESSDHQMKLVSRGIDSNKIIGQVCVGLETEIQNSPQSDIVKSMIELYLDEAIGKVSANKSKVIVSLCCSHYGFSAEIFNLTLKDLGIKDRVVLNPNEKMIEAIANNMYRNRFTETDVNVEVISRVEITKEEKDSISSIVAPYAKQTSNALQNYKLNPGLFNISEDKLK